MRNSLLLAWLLPVTLAAAAPLEDLHLNPVPRTAQERARIARVSEPTHDFSRPERFEARPGGVATVRAMANADAFSQPSATLDFAGELDFRVGNGLFRKIWVSSPASTRASDGLGPLYNARACQRCHLKDGRGHPPNGREDSAVSMFLRLSISANFPTFIEGTHATAPDPIYGHQLQDRAIQGHSAEGRMVIEYSFQEVVLNGGETVTLRKPHYRVENLAFGALHPEVMLSPRVAPSMIGLGLLEAIPVADILAHADPEDDDGDGISGRANIVWSPEFDRPMLGRFGLKAGAATVREQSAGAFAGDMGLSTSVFPAPYGECTEHQRTCREAVHGQDAEGLEVNDEALALVTFYSQNLAVPARRGHDDPAVLRGKAQFYASGCIGCHVPKHVTHRLPERPEHSFQLIWPYTNLLLHDMGEGLADHRPEHRANGREWRTAPLWGIGLTEQVSGHSFFLHDGRARNLLEAILWHGGEAQNARDQVVAMTPQERADLIHFLESL